MFHCISEIGHASCKPLAVSIVHDLFTDSFMPCHITKGFKAGYVMRSLGLCSGPVI